MFNLNRAQQEELAEQKHLIEEQAVEIAALKEKCKNEKDLDEITPAEEGTRSVLPGDHKPVNDVSNKTSNTDDIHVITTTVVKNDKPQMQRISKRQTNELGNISSSSYWMALAWYMCVNVPGGIPYAPFLTPVGYCNDFSERFHLRQCGQYFKFSDIFNISFSHITASSHLP